jgi:hypothetical protein
MVMPKGWCIEVVTETAGGAPKAERFEVAIENKEAALKAVAEWEVRPPGAVIRAKFPLSERQLEGLKPGQIRAL